MAPEGNEIIYKIVTAEQWAEAEKTGSFRGAPVDLADGYIHFSTVEQVRETATKHFAGQQDLLLVSVRTTRIAGDLKYEPSRGGKLFPHLYGDLPLSAIVDIERLTLDRNGHHEFPDLIP